MPTQLALALRYSDTETWLRVSGFVCARYRCRMSREACVKAQLAPKGRPGKVSDRYCREGGCRQGLEVLIQMGLARKAVCECCGGEGWIPRRLAPTQGGAR